MLINVIFFITYNNIPNYDSKNNSPNVVGQKNIQQ